MSPYLRIELALCINAAKTNDLPLAILLAPMLAALITRLIYQRNVRDLGRKLMKTEASPQWWYWDNSRYLPLGYGSPLLMGVLVYGLTWSLILGSFSTSETPLDMLVAFVSDATVGLIFTSVLSIGEEIAWRGFLTRADQDDRLSNGGGG